MSNSIYTNTAISNENWNSRAVITNNFVTKNAVVTDKNYLYVIFEDGLNATDIALSKDNGFTWNRVASISLPTAGQYTNNVTGLNTNGPIFHLFIYGDKYGKENYLGLLSSWSWVPNILTGERQYALRVNSYSINDDGTLTGLVGDRLELGEDKDYLAFDTSNTDDYLYIAYTKYNRLYINLTPAREINAVSIFNPIGANTIATPDADYYDLVKIYANKDRTLDVLAIRYTDNPTNLNYPNYLVYHQARKESLSISAPVTIKTLSNIDVKDMNIERDGYGNIVALWTEVSNDNTYAREFYSMSKDNGFTWSIPVEIVGESDNADFIDLPLGTPEGRTVLLGCLQGFIIGYIKKKNNKAVAYVRTLITENGFDYTLSAQRVAASHPTKDVTGIRFFRAPGNDKFNLNQIGEIRFLYQVGQGDSIGQFDNTPIYIGQKLLKDEAYVESLYVTRPVDTALQNQLLCSFNLIGSTALNIDYYDQGLTGNITAKYLASFNRFGTSVEISRYEPEQQAYSDNISAYFKYDTYFVKVFFDDINYALPQPSGNDTFDDFIERDTRQIHLPPNFHLGRTFIINDGNNLKRTVWLLKFGGNEYELTQVVPKFIDNQIAYYTSNAYVVGPSRDPFSRTILPSET